MFAAIAVAVMTRRRRAADLRPEHYAAVLSDPECPMSLCFKLAMLAHFGSTHKR
jgi:hypothetical protein